MQTRSSATLKAPVLPKRQYVGRNIITLHHRFHSRACVFGDCASSITLVVRAPAAARRLRRLRPFGAFQHLSGRKIIVITFRFVAVASNVPFLSTSLPLPRKECKKNFSEKNINLAMELCNLAKSRFVAAPCVYWEGMRVGRRVSHDGMKGRERGVMQMAARDAPDSQAGA